MCAFTLPTVDTRENCIVIDSLLHPLALPIRRLLTRAGRQELNQILIDDEENIQHALEAGVLLDSVYYAGDSRPSQDLIQRLPAYVEIHEVARRTSKKLFENDRISRIFAIARTPPRLDLQSLTAVSQDIVALEDLTISGNIGAIIRTSVALGVGAVVLLNTNPADIYDRRIIRASRGHIFSLPIVTATAEELIQFCQQSDLSLLAMAAHGDNLLDEIAPMSQRCVIVFGSEKNGCSRTLMEAATLRIRIPTRPGVESLNVSTAAAIMLYNRAWFNQSQARK
jgi:TrmH family RNA methyltransferase